MTDNSFSPASIRGQVRKIDFLNYPQLSNGNVLEAEIRAAERLLHSGQWAAHISYHSIAGKKIATTSSFASRLALRRVDKNLRGALRFHRDTREQIVGSLSAILAEGVPFRIYRLDVRKCFESFSHSSVNATLKNFRISNGTRRVVSEILANHNHAGGTGIPRGLSVSSPIAEMLLEAFDRELHDHPDVFFYRRFVDDIAIITSRREEPTQFVRHIESMLPPGLLFNTKGEKRRIVEFNRIHHEKSKAANKPKMEQVNFLGYAFNVASDNHRPVSPLSREVYLDIASAKVRRIKTRINRSYLDYLSTKDFPLLSKRLRHLTSNMSLLDRSRGVRRLIGIHFNYPLIDVDRSQALRDLDKFFRASLYSTKGAVFSQISKQLTPTQKATLLKNSFYAGAKSRRFQQLSVVELGKVQRCWKYA